MCLYDFIFFILQESHVDRGDTQRAIAIFRDISVSIVCNWLKKKPSTYTTLFLILKFTTFMGMGDDRLMHKHLLFRF